MTTPVIPEDVATAADDEELNVHALLLYLRGQIMSLIHILR